MCRIYLNTVDPVKTTQNRIFEGTINDPSLTISSVTMADIDYYRFNATNAVGSRFVVFY